MQLYWFPWHSGKTPAQDAVFGMDALVAMSGRRDWGMVKSCHFEIQRFGETVFKLEDGKLLNMEDVGF